MKSVRSTFIALSMMMSVFASVSQAQVMTSAYSCAAVTPCLDNYGNQIGQISCQVYGQQYFAGAGSSGSSCTWNTIPYRAVQCSGFQQVQNAYGQYVWAWQNVSFTCPY